MNYIKHLTKALHVFSKDDRLNTTHISMYLALFQYWNLNRFSNPVSISRGEIMALSKIGSKSTYHKCIKDLHRWNYIRYYPSYNPFKGSKVVLFNLGTGSKQVPVRNRPDNKQALIRSSTNNVQVQVPSKTYKNYKQNKHKLSIYIEFENVKKFFLENKSTEAEAEIFFNYYESTGWKIGGKAEIKNWQAAARNWIIKADEKRKEKIENAVDQNSNYLHVNNDKDYDIPL
ncbi:MAG: transcriptional regulator [Bacteroidota bacterium]